MKRKSKKDRVREGDPGFAACFCLGTELGPSGLDTCAFRTSSGLGRLGSATRYAESGSVHGERHS